MLCFITALKSKKVCKNWDRVQELFQSSLYSAYNQIDPDFKIIVVCHEKPKLKKEYDNRVEFIQVDFSPPPYIHKEMIKDKYKKLTKGMIRARELNPDFIMFKDADDLVSRRLSKYANNHKSENGWIIKKGYKWYYGRKWVYYSNKYDCGTNAIINSKCIKFPKDSSKKSVSECIVLTHGHPIIEKGMKEQGTPLKLLPFAGGVHVLGYGDNSQDLDTGVDKPWKGWRYFLRSLRNGYYWPLTENIKEEFSLV
ncbi:MAG: glycosyltransferase family 2 protein [Candidatus Woesearchaeota archaeon]